MPLEPLEYDLAALRLHARMLRCPACAGSLVAADRALACAGCGTAFNEAEGVIDLRHGIASHGDEPDRAPTAPHDGPAALDGMIRALLARCGETRTSLRTAHALEGAEHAWRLFLELRPGMRVLDLDCGYGARASSLAMHGADVVAVAFDADSAAVCARRLDAAIRKPSGRHLVLVAASACDLPLADSCIDVVLLPVDLATDRRGGRPGRKASSLRFGAEARCGARSLVAEAQRVLKPDAQAVLVAANRWAVQRWSMRARSLAARFRRDRTRSECVGVAELPARAESPSAARLQGLAGYRKLLRHAGMETATTLVLHRDGAGNLVDLRDSQARLPRARGLGMKARIKRSVILAPEFALVARRNPRGGQSLIRRALEAVAGQLHRRDHHVDSLRILRYYVSHKDKLVAELASGAGRMILRLCLTTAARNAEERAAAILTHLMAAFGEKRWYPRLLATGEVDGLYFTAEEKVAGKPLLDHRARVGEDWLFRMGSAALEAINPDLSARPPSVLDDSLYDALITAPLDRVGRAIGADEPRRALQRLFDERLRGIEIATGVVHGDLGLSNVLVDAGSFHAIIDWETGARVGLPILDAIGFVHSVAFRRRRTASPGDLRRTLALGDLSVPEQDFLSAAYARTRTPRGAHAALVYLQWVHAVSSLLDFSFMQRPAQLELHVGSVARDLAEVVQSMRSDPQG